MVNRIANHRIIISINASNGDLSPKNRIDHKMFNMSWTAKRERAAFAILSFMAFFHTRKRDIPISKNNVIQTGENNQLGGVKNGFLRVAYQVGIAGVVNREPMNPAN